MNRPQTLTTPNTDKDMIHILLMIQKSHSFIFIYPNEPVIYALRKIYTVVCYSSFIQNCQILLATKMSFNRSNDDVKQRYIKTADC